jgi:hypothetical protein
MTAELPTELHATKKALERVMAERDQLVVQASGLLSALRDRDDEILRLRRGLPDKGWSSLHTAILALVAVNSVRVRAVADLLRISQGKVESAVADLVVTGEVSLSQGWVRMEGA